MRSFKCSENIHKKESLLTNVITCNNRSYGTSNSSGPQRNDWGQGRRGNGRGRGHGGVAVGAVSEDVTNIRYPSCFGTFGGGTATKIVTAMY